LDKCEEKGILAWLGGESYSGDSLEEAIKKWGVRQLERLSEFPIVKEAVSRGRLQTQLLFFDLESLRMDIYVGDEWLELGV